MNAQRFFQNNVLGLVVMVVLVGTATSATRAAPPWNRFRGPNGDGVGESPRLPVTWTEQDYRWRVKLSGPGHSSPVVWKERLFVTAGDEETGSRTLDCREVATGKVIWRRSFAGSTHRKHKLNSFASVTPAVDDRHVYLSWATPEKYEIVAVDHSGREVWRRDLGTYRAGHGDGMSPIVWGDVVVVTKLHGGESALWGLDRHTGKDLWKWTGKSQAHWATPCVHLAADKQPELVFTNWAQGVTALDLRSGKRRWQADVFDKGHYEAAIASPLVADGLVIGIGGYLGYGNEVIAVRPSEPGGRPAEKVWRINRNAPLCVTPVVSRDRIYIWSDKGVVTCAELATGKPIWKKRVGGNYYSSPIAVSGRIYNISTDGTAIVLAAGDEYRLLGRTDLGEGSHSTMALAGERLLIRTFTQVLCLAP